MFAWNINFFPLPSGRGLSPGPLYINRRSRDAAPALQCRNRDGGIPAALRHPLIKNLKVGEKAGKAAVRGKIMIISTGQRATFGLTLALSRQRERRVAAMRNYLLKGDHN